ncbi:MAG TPA: TolC family protein [archaeon]|nr:TolC family protein [archaeon]
MRESGQIFSSRRLIILTAAFLSMGVLQITGCAALLRDRIDRKAPSGPNVLWKPPSAALTRVDTTRKRAEIPERLLASINRLTLEDVVDLALRNNPNTKASWSSARAAAAKMGSKQGDYFPSIAADGSLTKVRGSVAGGRFNYNSISYEPSLSLSYMLFDFGKRRAEVNAARYAFYAAGWTHNATVQNVILQVEQAYFQYLYVKSLREAQEASLKEYQANLDAAEYRHKAGLATIADVLQAKTTLSQSQLALQAVEGQIQTIRGSLATAMGLPADIDYDVGFLPNELPVDQVSETVEQLIAEAETERPDLAAARAQALEAQAHIKSVRREGLPSINLGGGWGRIYYNSRDVHSDVTNLGVYLSFPLFTGFSNTYDLLQAQAEAEVAADRAQSLEQMVILDVWTSYYDLKTAAQRLKTSEDLLNSATESQLVASGRYKAGVGSILELLSVQAALEAARAQNLQARTDWFLSLAQLAHDTGSLWLPRNPSDEKSPKNSEKDEKK